MTRSEAIKAFFFKSVLPVIVALILYCIFKSACMQIAGIIHVRFLLSRFHQVLSS